MKRLFRTLTAVSLCFFMLSCASPAEDAAPDTDVAAESPESSEEPESEPEVVSTCESDPGILSAFSWKKNEEIETPAEYEATDLKTVQVTVANGQLHARFEGQDVLAESLPGTSERLTYYMAIYSDRERRFSLEAELGKGGWHVYLIDDRRRSAGLGPKVKHPDGELDLGVVYQGDGEAPDFEDATALVSTPLIEDFPEEFRWVAGVITSGPDVSTIEGCPDVSPKNFDLLTKGEFETLIAFPAE